jgi:hypothetical protein
VEHSPALGIADGAPAMAGRLCRGYTRFLQNDFHSFARDLRVRKSPLT